MNQKISATCIARIALFLVVIPAAVSRAEPAKDYVIASFVTEAQQLHEQSNISFTYGGKTIKYIINRTLPDRLYMMVDDGNVKYE